MTETNEGYAYVSFLEARGEVVYQFVERLLIGKWVLGRFGDMKIVFYGESVIVVLSNFNGKLWEL